MEKITIALLLAGSLTFQYLVYKNIKNRQPDLFQKYFFGKIIHSSIFAYYKITRFYYYPPLWRGVFFRTQVYLIINLGIVMCFFVFMLLMGN